MNEWNKEIQNENELQVVISVSKAEELGKWLGILFWMVIPSIAGAVLSNQAVAAWLPFLYLPGRIISMVTLCAYGYILLKLSSEAAATVWQRFAVWHPLQWMQEALWFRRALLWLR